MRFSASPTMPCLLCSCLTELGRVADRSTLSSGAYVKITPAGIIGISPACGCQLPWSDSVVCFMSIHSIHCRLLHRCSLGKPHER
jgi:hypothetical protein